ncbi:MAG TPA: 5-formyltetrahydrofolate cyclo-ligase [Nevskiaceae bacterium]|nr:5-formyltetrahydrofolate cyclo-ligase [Nevskiaceae bacterium]
MSPSSAKPDLRKELRAARKAIPASARTSAAHDAARNFLRNRKLASARRVALYHAHGSELDTSTLIDALLRASREVFLPVVTARTTLKFVELRATSALRRGRHGIATPARGAASRLSELDAIVVPLLAFDARGHRLGSGAGYYDRLLARPRPFRRPFVVGYAYAMQERSQLPTDPWDQRLDAIVTERGVTWFERK